MKKLFYVFAVMILAMSVSCKSDDDATVEKTTITTELEVTILTGEDYFYDLGNFGDEEGVAITTSPTNASISEILFELDPNRYIYKYSPEEGFVGTDFVVLTTAKGSDGASPNPNIEFIEITILVIEE